MLARPLMDRMTQPYMGLYNEKQWDRKGVVGRFMGPIEDIYFDLMPNEALKQKLNINNNRLISE